MGLRVLGLRLKVPGLGFRAEGLVASRKCCHCVGGGSSKLSQENKALFDEAAVAGWKAYVDNDAVQVLSMAESARVRQELARRGEMDRIMKPRFVLVDKHEPLRTKEHDLPIKASARLSILGPPLCMLPPEGLQVGKAP